MRLTTPFLLFSLVLVAACAGGSGNARQPLFATLAATSKAPAASDTPTSTPNERSAALPARKENVVDHLFGRDVADPYRWMEDADSHEVKVWTDAENEATRKVLDAIPGRDKLSARIHELMAIGMVSSPAAYRMEKGGWRYFYTKRSGNEPQAILYMRDGVSGADKVLIDPAKSGDTTTALDWWYPSWDGGLLAYGLSTSGSEESSLHVRDLSTGAELPDVIPHTRHASLAWTPNKKGFYYSRYPDPGTVPAGDEKYFSKIYFHLLGTDYKADKLLFERKEKTDVPQVMISPNGRWLIARVHIGWDRSEVFVRDRSKGDAAPWVPFAAGEHAVFNPIARNEKLYIHTNAGASRYKLYAVEYDHPDRKLWKEVLAEGKDVLDDVTITKSEIIVGYMHDASTRLERFTMQGKSKGAIALSAIGAASTNAAWDGDEAFVHFTSFVVPPEVQHLDLHTGKLDPWVKLGEGFKADGVEVKLHWATSKDGTKVPMFVISRAGMVLDGSNPTILWGYGGFNVNMTPSFSARALSVVERGGVWVTSVLRGGGEYGEAWHEDGMLEKKQHVFDDFIACAETLIAEKITSKEKLAVMGGSNGGLLTSAMLVQRPDLFRAVLSLVPLTDMLRYHKFRIGRLWVSEYGDPDDAKGFETLYAYSPYHHVVDGTKYPATLFTTAESDSRVDPMHARKMAARVQAAQVASDRPVLIRVESKAGHGAGKPLDKQVAEMTDELGFALNQLGVSL